MITKNELLESMVRECRICVHLHTKIPEGGLDFRFTEPQRSTLELLRYLSFVGLGVARSYVTGDWEAYGALQQAAAEMTSEEFPAAMERQEAGLRELFEGLSDDDVASKRATPPWGIETSVGQAILELGYASMVAYRMQLFLQIKSAGRADIGTPNNWAGMDMPKDDG